jgi:hypothetical protein
LKKGTEVFKEIAKLNFKNYQKLIEKKDWIFIQSFCF